jgi:hypothetical protein
MLFSLNTINPSASFDKLSYYTGRPVGIPPQLDNLNRLGQVTFFSSTYMSTSAAVLAGFGAFGAFQASNQYQVWSSDYGAYANQPDNDPSNGIDGWTYGVGYRIGILMEKGVGSLKAGPPVFAAEVTLNNSTMLVQIVTYGMPDAPPIPVTDLSSFDVNAYAKYVNWQNEVHNHVATHHDALIPVLTHASLSSSFDKLMASFSPAFFAIKRVAAKDTLGRTKQICIERNWDLDLPATLLVYKRCTGDDRYIENSNVVDALPISDAAANVAKSILSWYN